MMYKTILTVLIISGLWSCKEVSGEVDTSQAIKQIDKANNLNDSVDEKVTIEFPSKDGLLITADVYKVGDKPVSILLCHQARFSRGEYKDTALKLNALGYSVMAIDQRSGDSANNIINETAKLAKSKNLPTGYLDARQDIEAAIDYIYTNNGGRPILLLGSSYSASLSLLIANNNNKVKKVAAFSPGEYFKGVDIQGAIKDYNKPVFVTASNSETQALTTLVSKINGKYLYHYKPKEKGIHGSRALWDTTDGSEGYWIAFKAFLDL
ncbi:serine aminopeptidase domain-containing protein [Pontimicrobium sp. MEBiC01747]